MVASKSSEWPTANTYWTYRARVPEPVTDVVAEAAIGTRHLRPAAARQVTREHDSGGIVRWGLKVRGKPLRTSRSDAESRVDVVAQ